MSDAKAGQLDPEGSQLRWRGVGPAETEPVIGTPHPGGRSAGRIMLLNFLVHSLGRLRRHAAGSEAQVRSTPTWIFAR